MNFLSGEEGIRRSTENPLEITLLDEGGAESGALTLEPDLLALIEAWPTLPDPIKAAMVALLNSAVSKRYS